MSYLLYLIFRCDRRCDGCDGKFGNLVGTKHTLCCKCMALHTCSRRGDGLRTQLTSSPAGQAMPMGLFTGPCMWLRRAASAFSSARQFVRRRHLSPAVRSDMQYTILLFKKNSQLLAAQTKRREYITREWEPAGSIYWGDALKIIWIYIYSIYISIYVAWYC